LMFGEEGTRRAILREVGRVSPVWCMALSPDDIVGLEFDWLAVDRTGSIALLCSGGWNSVPAEALLVASPGEPLISRSPVLAALPEVCGFRTEGPGLGWCREWPALGRRGFYVYDSDQATGSYRCIIVPLAPVLASSLPSGLLRPFAPVVLGRTRFADVSALRLGAGYE
jgi:hypothetical protein